MYDLVHKKRSTALVGNFLAHIAKKSQESCFWMQMLERESITLPSVCRSPESSNDQTVDATVVLRTIQSPIEGLGAVRAVTRNG